MILFLGSERQNMKSFEGLSFITGADTRFGGTPPEIALIGTVITVPYTCAKGAVIARSGMQICGQNICRKPSILLGLDH